MKIVLVAAIGKPLKDRTNIVLTKDLGLVAPGAVLATSMDGALAYARKDAAARGVDEIMITTMTHDHADRRRSYEMLAEAFALAAARDTSRPAEVLPS